MILNVVIGGIVGLIAGIFFVDWLRDNQPEVIKPSLWVDAVGVVIITIAGALIGLLRHVDNKPKNKTS